MNFRDGKKLVGKVEVKTAGEVGAFRYSGALERLGIRIERGTILDLEFIFNLLAQKEGAALLISRCGEFEHAGSKAR